MPEQDYQFDYENDTAIDPDELFEEWVGLSSLFFKYQKELIRVEKEVKQIWEVKKTTRAELIKQAKLAGAKNDADREAFFRPHPEYIKAVNDLINIEYERDLVQAAITAFYRKEKGIEGAVSMAKMEWWRGPKELLEVPGGKRVAADFKAAKANERRATTATRSRSRK